MKRKLEMDDIREGMYITVLRGKMERRVLPMTQGGGSVTRERDHYNGKVLEVTALELPYIAVKVHEPLRSRNDSLDLRQIEVQTIGPEYIHNIVPDLELQVDSFWGEIRDTSLEDADTSIEEIFKDL